MKLAIRLDINISAARYQSHPLFPDSSLQVDLAKQTDPAMVSSNISSAPSAPAHSTRNALARRGLPTLAEAPGLAAAIPDTHEPEAIVDWYCVSYRK